MPTIKLWVENNLYLVGGVAVGVAISLVSLDQIVLIIYKSLKLLLQMVILRLSKTLEEQISQQKALWNKQ